MVGIYKYSNGLEFTGIVADTYEEAEKYLSYQHGYMTEKFIGWEEDKYSIFETVFCPYYNKEVYKIYPITKI